MRFGFHFGAAFQIRDDLLNLVGDERTYGKEILGDLYEGKRTLPLVHLLAIATGADRALVRDYLRRDRAGASAGMVRAVRALMDDYGSIEFTSEFAEGILLVAEAYFEQAFAGAQPGPDLDFLRSLVPLRLGAVALMLPAPSTWCTASSTAGFDCPPPPRRAPRSAFVTGLW